MHGRGQAGAAATAATPDAAVNPAATARPASAKFRRPRLHTGDRSDDRVLPPLQVGDLCPSPIVDVEIRGIVVRNWPHLLVEASARRRMSAGLGTEPA